MSAVLAEHGADGFAPAFYAAKGQADVAGLSGPERHSRKPRGSPDGQASADEAAHGLGVGTAESGPPSPQSRRVRALLSGDRRACRRHGSPPAGVGRFLFLALAAPGFFAVFATPIHHSLIAMLVGFGLFGAAIVFRLKTEPLFRTGAAADLWPSPDPAPPQQRLPAMSRLFATTAMIAALAVA